MEHELNAELQDRLGHIENAIDSWCNHKDESDLELEKVKLMVTGMIWVVDDILEESDEAFITYEESRELYAYAERRVEGELDIRRSQREQGLY